MVYELGALLGLGWPALFGFCPYHNGGTALGRLWDEGEGSLPGDRGLSGWV